MEHTDAGKAGNTLSLNCVCNMEPSRILKTLALKSLNCVCNMEHTGNNNSNTTTFSKLRMQYGTE